VNYFTKPDRASGQRLGEAGFLLAVS
jgi:hypothetical protein